MNISVIIPMYNSEDTILQTLRGLENQTRKDFEVVVVDDGSTDASPKLVKEFMKQTGLTIILLKQENSGPAKARNFGVENSKGDIIIFLDSDCIPPENWLDAMVSPLIGNTAVCQCGYRVKNGDKLIARYADYEIARRHDRLVGENIDAFGTNSASFLKNVFKEAGGFDTKYRDASGEDFDLAFRIKKMGYDLTGIDKTFVYHYHPDSLKNYLKQQFNRGYWRVELYLKNWDKIIDGDSYTRHEPQVQFILSTITLISLLFIVVYPRLTALSFIVLLISNVPLGLWAFKKEKKFLYIAPIVSSMRSIVGTLGVYKYILINMRRTIRMVRKCKF